MRTPCLLWVSGAPDLCFFAGFDPSQCVAGADGPCSAPMNRRTLLPSDTPQSLVLADAAETSAAGIVSRTVLQTPELRVVLFAFAEGQELTTHASSRRALVQVLEGNCEFLFAGEWHDLAAGALLHLPPSHTHAVRASMGLFSMLLTLGSEPAGPSEAIRP